MILERHVLSGCSGGGKSTLLTALADRGYDIVPEPGRQIVREQLEKGGDALPWLDARAFAECVIERAVAAFDAVESNPAPVFFDRSFLDAISFLEDRIGDLPRVLHDLIRERRYSERIFMVPPWREIFVNDSERQLGFEDAVAEYGRLLETLPGFGYVPVVVPKAPIDERVDFVLDAIAEFDRPGSAARPPAPRSFP